MGRIGRKITMSETLYIGKKDAGVLDYLQRRRSCKLVQMGEPGPDADDINTILSAGLRIPDHGKLFPWRAVVFTGEARVKFGAVLREAYAKEDKEAAPAKLDLEAQRLLRAPCVIALISSPVEAKHPEWEQVLSAGAAAYNVCLAANAMGYGSNWLTEWYSYNADVQAALGLGAREKIAGFIYIGTANGESEERPRPEIKDKVTYWR